jgi:hypothetical protein
MGLENHLTLALIFLRACNNNTIANPFIFSGFIEEEGLIMRLLRKTSDLAQLKYFAK